MHYFTNLIVSAGQPGLWPFCWAWKRAQPPQKPMKWHLWHICVGFVRKIGFLVNLQGFDLSDVTLSDLYGSGWPLIEFLCPEIKSDSPPKKENDYFNKSEMLQWEKLDPWPFFQDLTSATWVKVTSSQIFKFRKRISIPKTPQNNYLSMSEIFSEGIIGKLVQKLFQKQQNCKNQIFRLKKNCKFEWKMTLDSVIRRASMSSN